MRSTWIWVVILIIIIGGGFWWWESNQTPAVDTGASSVASQSQTSAADQGSAAPTTDAPAINQPQDTTPAATPSSAVTVTYDGNSFSPSSVPIKQGGTVTFTDTSGSMWIASNSHPSHTGYDGTSRGEHCASGYTGARPFDQCSRGTSYTLTFTKTGSWGYHDHLNDVARGIVVVQ